MKLPYLWHAPLGAVYMRAYAQEDSASLANITLRVALEDTPPQEGEGRAAARQGFLAAGPIVLYDCAYQQVGNANPRSHHPLDSVIAMMNTCFVTLRIQHITAGSVSPWGPRGTGHSSWEQQAAAVHGAWLPDGAAGLPAALGQPLAALPRHAHLCRAAAQDPAGGRR